MYVRDVLRKNGRMDCFTCSSDHFWSISFPHVCVTAVSVAHSSQDGDVNSESLQTISVLQTQHRTSHHVAGRPFYLMKPSMSCLEKGRDLLCSVGWTNFGLIWTYRKWNPVANLEERQLGFWSPICHLGTKFRFGETRVIFLKTLLLTICSFISRPRAGWLWAVISTLWDLCSLPSLTVPNAHCTSESPLEIFFKHPCLGPTSDQILQKSSRRGPAVYF